MQETVIGVRVLTMNCSAAGPLPKLTAMRAASEAFQLQLKFCSFYE